MFKIVLVLIHVYYIQCITHENTVLTAPPWEENYPNYNEKNTNPLKFLQKYNSGNSIVLLIDDVQQCHDEASRFLKSLRKLTPKIENVDFMLMRFNSSGVSPVLATIKNNRNLFEQLLSEKIDESSSFLGYGNSSKSAVFFGITNAAYALPPKSGIVVFMNRDISDEAVAPLALQQVAKKRIQVFVISSAKKEDSLLRELAERSHGAFFLASRQNLSAINYENFLENIDSFTSASLLLSRKNLRDVYNLDFPIDSDVTGIHISITPDITLGILTTPKGYKMNVLDDKEVSQFSTGSFINRENGIHVHLNTTTATQDVGIWRLRVGNARTLYNITMFAHTELTTNAVITSQNTDKKQGTTNKIVKLGFTGDISLINNISFIGEDGKPIVNNVKYTIDKKWENYLTEDIETTEKKEVNVNFTIPKGPFYAIVKGKDSQGKDFRRLSYVRHDRRREYLPPLTVELREGSELITEPFRQPQLLFEVTNNGYTPTLVRFHCGDDKGILQSMVPWYKWISPDETATVRVTLTPRAGAYQDFITFTASGTESQTKRVIVDVGTRREDRRSPDLDYYFPSNCIGVPSWSCEDSTWTVEVKARDKGSGLLQITSIPRGLYFPSGFTSGTTEELIGVYSESCCNPDLEVIAIDRQNNRRVRQINAYSIILGPGAIAAIVIGVILFILIIIGLVVVCRRCHLHRKEKGSYDLPVYRGPRRT